MAVCPAPVCELYPESNGGPWEGFKDGRGVVNTVSLKGLSGCHVEHALGWDRGHGTQWEALLLSMKEESEKGLMKGNGGGLGKNI